MENKDEDLKNLNEQQKKPLDEVNKKQKSCWELCAHNACVNCSGTGIGKDNKQCVHFISCTCPKCSFY